MKLGLISRSLEQGWFEKIHHLQDGGEKCHLQQGLGYIWCRHWGLWQEDFIAHPNIRLCHCGHRSLLRSIYALLPGRGEISRTSHAFAWFQGCLRICRQKALGGKIFSFLTAIFTWCTLKEKKNLQMSKWLNLFCRISNFTAVFYRKQNNSKFCEKVA